MFGKRSVEEGQTSVLFPAATQEHFEVFADEVAALVDDCVVEYEDRPIFGEPYVIIRFVRDFIDYTFVVDVGESLCRNGEDLWVSR